MTSKTIELGIKNNDHETLVVLLELVLCSTLYCEEKDDFVRDMLSLDSSIQVHLMGILEAHMQQASAASAEDLESEDSSVSEERMYSTKETEIKRVLRENEALKSELVHMTKIVDETKSSKEEAEKNLESLRQQIKEDRLHSEANAIRNEK